MELNDFEFLVYLSKYFSRHTTDSRISTARIGSLTSLTMCTLLFGQLIVRYSIGMLPWHQFFSQGKFSPARVISCFLGLVIVGLISSRNGYLGVEWGMSYPESRRILGGHDAGSYLSGAMQILGDERFNADENRFVWELWPPGMSLLLAIFGYLEIFYNNAILVGILIQALSGAILWEMAFLLLFKRFGASIAAMFAFGSLLFPPYFNWVYGDGLLYTEGPTIALLATALYLYAKANEVSINQQRNYVLSSGLLFGVATYLRGFLDSAFIFTFSIFLVVVMMRKNRGKFRTKFVPLTIGYALIQFPWRFIKSIFLDQSFFSWGLSPRSIWSAAISSEQQLASINALDWAGGNMNWMCHLEPRSCMNLEFANFHSGLVIIFSNFWDFIILRASLTIDYFAAPGETQYPSNPSPFNVALVLYIAYWLFNNTRTTVFTDGFSLLFSIAIPLSVSGIIVLSHFEGRYFLLVIYPLILGLATRASTSSLGAQRNTEMK